MDMFIPMSLSVHGINKWLNVYALDYAFAKLLTVYSYCTGGGVDGDGT